MLPVDVGVTLEGWLVIDDDGRSSVDLGRLDGCTETIGYRRYTAARPFGG